MYLEWKEAFTAMRLGVRSRGWAAPGAQFPNCAVQPTAVENVKTISSFIFHVQPSFGFHYSFTICLIMKLFALTNHLGEVFCEIQLCLTNKSVIKMLQNF